MDSIEYLKSKHIQFREIKLAEIPRTAKDVERIYSCPLEQVLKTLVFIGKKPIVVVLQGDRKVNLEKLKSIANEKEIRMPSPQEIKKLFGKDVGSLDPFIRVKDCIKIMDKKVFAMDIVNMGGGTPGVGVEMETEELRKAWDGKIKNVST